MHLLECVFTLEHCTTLRWRVAHLERFSPYRGILFYRYRERARERLVLEIGCEESRVVALMMFTCIRIQVF